MAMKHLYTIMCDEVREEKNGKLMIIGMYTPDMSVPQIPFQVRTLTFFTVVESDVPGDFAFRMKLCHLETGKAIMEANGGIQIKRPGKCTLIAPLPSIQFQAVGPYTFSVNLTETKETLLVHQFSVLLRIPKQRQEGG